MSADENATENEKETSFEPRELVAVENLARTEALGILGWARQAEAGTYRRAVVFAGRTSAGACGMALARHLRNYGIECRTVLCGPEYRLSALASIQREILFATVAPLYDFMDTDEVRTLASGLSPESVLVDAAGDAPAPGREEEFAGAVRKPSSAGRVVKLAPDPEYIPPPPAPEDAVFSPDAGPRSREDVRLLDSIAIERYRIPGLVLMENAGWRAAREAYAMLGFEPGSRVLVVAGAGNNGGDGFVAARHLAGWGVEVGVVLTGSREKVLDDAKANLELAEADGIEVTEAALAELVGAVLPGRLEGAALVVDALLGTGLSGKVRGAAARAIEMLNERGARVLAVDTPSGLDANTGEALGVAARAERTVTFAFPKLGFTRGEGPARAGVVVVADISMPRELWEGRGGNKARMKDEL